MMKKAVPLSLILASSGVLCVPDYFASSAWTISGTPAAKTATCCYYNTGVAISSTDVVTGQIATGTTAPANSGDGCYDFTSAGSGPANSVVATSSGNQVWTQTLGTPAAVGTTSAINSGSVSTGTAGDVGNKANFWTISNNGNTLTMKVSPLTGAGASATCADQTFTRTTAAIPSLVGTWSVGAATGTGCCFLNTANNLVIATNAAGTTTSVSGGKFATDTTNCLAANAQTSGGDYTKTLKAGTSPVTAIDTANYDTFTLSNDQITYRPGGSATCSQTLTKVSSSGVHLASIMTPAVVGGAMLGLVVV